jgi:hypothetical protein
MSTQTAPKSPTCFAAAAHAPPPFGEGSLAVSAEGHLVWLGVGIVVPFTAPFVRPGQPERQHQVIWDVVASRLNAWICATPPVGTVTSVRAHAMRRTSTGAVRSPKQRSPYGGCRSGAGIAPLPRLCKRGACARSKVSPMRLPSPAARRVHGLGFG